jgi:Mce-associated membrane protein
MDVITDSSATVTTIDSSVATAPPPRRRRATRPTGPPAEGSGVSDRETSGSTTTSTITPVSDTPADLAEPTPEHRRARRFPRPGLGRPRLGSNGFRIVAVVLAVVALAAAATVAGLAWRDHQRTAAQEHRQAAIIDVARRAVTDLINIDKASAAKDFAGLGDITTAPFSDELHSQSGDYLKTVQDADVQSTGQVLAAGIAADDGTASDGAVTVIIAADAKVTNTQSRQQEQRAYRFSVKVEQVGGVPKVSDVEFVP